MLLAVCYFNGIYLFIFALLLTGIGAIELWKMFFKKGVKVSILLAVAFPLILVIAAYYGYNVLDFFVLMFIITSLSVIIRNFRNDQSSLQLLIEAIFAGSLVLIYCGLTGVYILKLGGIPIIGWQALILIFLVVWATDTAAYFGGKTFGKAKLAPGISPGKTIAGFYAGFFGAALAGIVGYFVLNDLRPDQIALICFIACLIGQLGDLFESAIKRYCDVKDSSSLLPGHGGILDRFDSFLMAVPAVYFVISILK